jgi:hypothetical protein
LKSLTLLVRVEGMKKIDDKKIKGISIELDRRSFEKKKSRSFS